MPGRVEYNLTSAPFPMGRDGEVELSFRLRGDAAEDGTWTPGQAVTVDLRSVDPRALQWKPVAERYPVLKLQVRGADLDHTPGASPCAAASPTP